MSRLSLTELEGLPWEAKKYRQAGDRKLGYDKAKVPGFDLGLPGTVVDFVRVQPGHIIEEHYHEDASEVFAVLEGEAVLQTRENAGEERTETPLTKGDAFNIDTRLLHRVENRSDRPFYLMRAARKVEGDYISTESL